MKENEYEFIGFWDLRDLGEKEAFPCFNNHLNSSVSIPADKYSEVIILNYDEFLKQYKNFKSYGLFIHDGKGNEIKLEA